MKRQRWRFVSFVLLFILTTLACVVPGISTPTPVPSPTPLGDTLSFFIPVYAYTLEPGETVPGTRLGYMGSDDGMHNVTIDGLAATKRVGDSFFWNGVIAPGVYASYELRITTNILGGLPVAGPVEIVVFNPTPVERATLPDMADVTVSYSAIAVDYLILEGRQIPGTTLTYEGLMVQGEGDQTTTLARLSGLRGYPNLAWGDSLVWTGNLLNNTVVRYSLRALSITENGLRLGGTAELWITGSP